MPWHRVVGAGGRISPRAGPGPLLQRRRLVAEGVRFVRGRVDLARHGLLGEPCLPLKGGSPRSRCPRCCARPCARKTGVLRAVRTAVCKTFTSPRAGSSSPPPTTPTTAWRDAAAEGPHQLPRARGVGARAQGEQAAGHHPGGERRHPLRDLIEGVTEQVQEIVYSLFPWEDGT